MRLPSVEAHEAGLAVGGRKKASTPKGGLRMGVKIHHHRQRGVGYFEAMRQWRDAPDADGSLMPIGSGYKSVAAGRLGVDYAIIGEMC